VGIDEGQGIKDATNKFVARRQKGRVDPRYFLVFIKDLVGRGCVCWTLLLGR
jgi:hypothetical protein